MKRGSHETRHSGAGIRSMTIVVTGGAGFIGSNYIFYMLDKPGFRFLTGYL